MSSQKEMISAASMNLNLAKDTITAAKEYTRNVKDAVLQEKLTSALAAINDVKAHIAARRNG